MTEPTRLVELTWPRVRERLDGGQRSVLFAAGSTEQHGPHLPLVTDTLLGDALAEGVCRRLPHVLLGPTLALGVSPHHMAFPGTISLTPQTFKATVAEYTASLAAHGFEKVLIVPSHGGNFAPIAALVEETDGRIGSADLVAYTDLQEFVRVLADVGRADGIPPETSGSHAGEAETSIVRALATPLVDMERAVAGFTDPFDPEVEAALFAKGTHALSEVGVLGDARPATEARGHRYLDGLVDLLVAYFEERL